MVGSHVKDGRILAAFGIKAMYCRIIVLSYSRIIVLSYSRIYSNDFPTTNQLNKYIKYINLGDPIAVLGSIDSVLGSVDLWSSSIITL